MNGKNISATFSIYGSWSHFGVREMKVYGWQAEIWPYIEELWRYEIELLMAI